MQLAKFLALVVCVVLASDDCEAQFSQRMIKISWVTVGPQLGSEGYGPKVEDFVLIFLDDNTGFWYHDVNGNITTGLDQFSLDTQRTTLKAIRELQFSGPDTSKQNGDFFQISVSEEKQTSKLTTKKIMGNSKTPPELRDGLFSVGSPLAAFRENCTKTNKIHPASKMFFLMNLPGGTFDEPKK